MTKTAFFVSLVILAAAGQAAAGETPGSGPQNPGASDPCLLGNAPDKTACAGMTRVAPDMAMQSRTYNSPSSQGSGPIVLFDPNRGYNSAAAPKAQPEHVHAGVPGAPPQQTLTVAPTPSAPQSPVGSISTNATSPAPSNQITSMNCVAPQTGTNGTCPGHQVHGPQVTAQPQPQPQAAQVAILQPPAPNLPMMLPPLALLPQTTLPTPTLPPVLCCQQQEVTLIPASFFMGGMSYGVGYPTQNNYSYGGGFYAFVGGGTRFSGVRDHVHLVPPPRRHPNPPPKPCGCH